MVLVDGDDLPERAADAVGGKPIRLGIDAVAGAATDRIAQCLGPGATLVNYGAMSRQACALAPQSFIFNDITLRGSGWPGGSKTLHPKNRWRFSKNWCR